VECLRSNEAQAKSNSLDYDTLKEMLIKRHFLDAPAAGVSNADDGFIVGSS